MCRFLKNYRSILGITHFLIIFLVTFLILGINHLGVVLFYSLVIIWGLYINEFYSVRFDIRSLKLCILKFFKTFIFIILPFYFFLYLFEFNNQYFEETNQLLIKILVVLSVIVLLTSFLLVFFEDSIGLRDILDGISMGLIPETTVFYIICNTSINIITYKHYNIFVLQDYNLIIKILIILPVIFISLLVINYVVALIKKFNKSKIIILGCNEEAAELFKIIQLLPNYLYSFVGFIRYEKEEINVISEYVINNIDDIEEYCISKEIDVILKTSTTSFNLDKARLFHCEILNTIDIYEEIAGKIPLNLIDLNYLINNINLHNRLFYSVHKRIMDLITASIILLVTLPVMLVLFIIIKIVDKGPFLFLNERMEIDGKPFQAYKVRTMIQNAQEKLFVVHQGKGKDPRWLPFASIVRATRLDEIPQMINIIQGTMSLIGPRPDQKVLQKELESLHPLQKYRRLIKPGWSGWAQIYSGHFETLEESLGKVSYDIYYLKNCSLMLDLTIFFRALILIFTNAHK